MDLDVDLWFEYFTKIDSILVPDIENISTDQVQFGMWPIHFLSTVQIFMSNYIFSSRLFALHGGLSQNGRNTVQGTFDDLSEEEKTRAYLQFLQYHQQLEQENETKRFQQMLNRNNDDDNNLNEDAKDDFDNNNVSSDDKTENVWYGLSHSRLNFPSISYIIFLIMVILAV